MQTPEHWLGECEILDEFWRGVGERLGGCYIGHGGGRWEILKKRLLGGVGNEWLTLGWALAVWVGLAGHWWAVFEEDARMSKEEKLARWEGLLVDILSGWQKGWGPQRGCRWKLVEVICERSEERVQVGSGEVGFVRVGVGGRVAVGVG